MLLIFAITVGVILACAFYLMLRRSIVRLIVGLALMTYGVNLLIFSLGDLTKRGAPIIDETPVENMADPLPQALILTAIVISFGVLAFTMALGYRASQVIEGDDLDTLRAVDTDE
ncbi:MAG: NADH-quinone oxidoreductase subunit K [Chloroflexota bacterium]|nr:MAG: cation:proton antiporter [Chloroflexota bacterium]